MANSIIVQFTEDEFRRLLKNCITESLNYATLTKSEPIDRHLSVKEAAEFLHLAPQTLYGYTSKRTIPFIKKVKKLHFKKSDLEKWLAEGRKHTKKEIQLLGSKKEKGGKHG